MLHYVRKVNQTEDKLGYNLSEDPQAFSELLDLIEKAGYQTISTSALLDQSHPLPKKPIVLVFDDGYEDFYTNAWPELQKHNFTASVAVITSSTHQDTTGKVYLTEKQVQELDQKGIEILSHTVTHPDLSKLTVEQQTKELQDSQTTLEKILKHPITGLVYPSGKYNEDTIKIAQQLGYQIAFTTKPGLADSNHNPFEQPRIRVDNRENLKSLLPRL